MNTSKRTSERDETRCDDASIKVFVRVDPNTGRFATGDILRIRDRK